MITQNINLIYLDRYCAICSKKLEVTVYQNKTYKGDHYFGKVDLGKSKKVEYWECNKCYYD